MKKLAQNNKKTTIDDLAIMVAKGFANIDEKFIKADKEFNNIDKRFDEVKSEINEVKENLRITRNDVLNIGDKFVSYHTFDQLASRVSNLEKKANKK